MVWELEKYKRNPVYTLPNGPSPELLPLPAQPSSPASSLSPFPHLPFSISAWAARKARPTRPAAQQRSSHPLPFLSPTDMEGPHVIFFVPKSQRWHCASVAAASDFLYTGRRGCRPTTSHR